MFNLKELCVKAIEILKDTVAVRIVIFAASASIFVLPDSLLKRLSLDSGSLPVSWRSFIGAIAIIFFFSLVVDSLSYGLRKGVLYLKLAILRHKMLKMLQNLSREEKLLLITAVKMNMPTVFCSMDHPIAQSLVSRSLLEMSTSIADPLRYPFMIPEHIWSIMRRNAVSIFIDPLNMTEQELLTAISEVIKI